MNQPDISPEISVIVPVFNSVETLRPLLIRVQKTMAYLGHSFEIIFVEDGGSTDSWGELLKLKKEVF